MKTDKKNPAGFYKDLKLPVFTQAPMADVTDAAFRKLIAKYGKPDILFTEFVTCDGLCSPGRKNLLKHLLYDETERPIVAQIWGGRLEKYKETAELIVDLGFDGIDINMGCPVKNVTRIGGGASLIKDPQRAKKIIEETKKGAGDLPVTVKTRIGYNQIIVKEWMEHLLETEPAAITLHLRTAKEMSKVEAHWEEIHLAVEMTKNTNTLIFGNGDIKDLDQADKIIEETNLDGVMLGRAIFGNPWLFDRSKTYDQISLDERLTVLVEHAELYEKIFTGKNSKSFLLMRKHILAYISGFNGAKDLRIKLQGVNNAAEVKEIVSNFKSSVEFQTI